MLYHRRSWSVHDGSFGNAKKLIDVAAQSAADVVKFKPRLPRQKLSEMLQRHLISRVNPATNILNGPHSRKKDRKVWNSSAKDKRNSYPRPFSSNQWNSKLLSYAMTSLRVRLAT